MTADVKAGQCPMLSIFHFQLEQSRYVSCIVYSITYRLNWQDLTSPTNKSLSVSPKTMNDSGVFGFDEDLKERNYNTVCLPVDPKKLSRSDSTHGSQMSIFTMFSKIGNNSSNKNGKELTENEAEKENRTRGGITSSLRRAIFNRVNSSTLKGKEPKDLISGGRECQSRPNRRRTPDELRRLWKTAIKQQILLIQMEKENRRLRGKIIKIIIMSVTYN